MIYNFLLKFSEFFQKSKPQITEKAKLLAKIAELENLTIFKPKKTEWLIFTQKGIFKT